jgi:hypothetical protein
VGSENAGNMKFPDPEACFTKITPLLDELRWFP